LNPHLPLRQPRKRVELEGEFAINSATKRKKAVPNKVNNAKTQSKPNILVIFGDDIGIPQISAYTMGLMGYKTPNIDCIVCEGVIFTDFYG